jgi:hypothetical protein
MWDAVKWLRICNTESRGFSDFTFQNFHVMGLYTNDSKLNFCEYSYLNQIYIMKRK